MAQHDDISSLRRMRDRGEIDLAEYEARRRQLLWGTPVPDPRAGRSPDAADVVPTARMAARRGGPGRRGNRRGRAAFLLALLLVVAIVAAGVWWFVLRKRNSVPPARYATAVCATAQSWRDDVAAQDGQLQRALSSNDDPEAVRDTLASYFDQVAGRTDRLRTEIAAAGTPAIEGGSAYAATLDGLLQRTISSLRDAAQRTHGLDPAARTSFDPAVQALQAQTDQVIGAVTDSLASTSAPAALRTAYSNTSSCAPFTG
ncbi:MAG: SHOCT domain-containing protein [Actinobacteria bacterium]|nr:SHOCT domain-containing protein [Actinomycetota bacterium]MBI3686123.1 SHOCT domain-containing protein [Actinomycetota bacterium]